MAAAALPLIIGAGVLNASQQYQAGQNASRSATIASNQLDQNAAAAETAAGQAKASSQRKSAEVLRQNKLFQSKQIAIAAASGASTSEKNISDILSNTEAEGRLASSIALYEGDLRSQQFLDEAIGLKNKATITRYEGKQARQAGKIGAVSSLLNSGAQASTFYARYGQRAPADTGALSPTYLKDDNNYNLNFDYP